MTTFTKTRKISLLLTAITFTVLEATTYLAVAGCTSKEKTATESVSTNKGQTIQASLPGANPFDKALICRFEEMIKRRGKDYHPRTRHLRPDGWAKYTNRLFLESSPYLLQHAHNPVNWFPWGDEAFDLARKLNRPDLVWLLLNQQRLFLSFRQPPFRPAFLIKLQVAVNTVYPLMIPVSSPTV